MVFRAAEAYLAVKSASCSCIGPRVVPLTHVRWLTTTYNSVSNGSDALWLPWVHMGIWCLETHIGTHTHIGNKLITKSNERKSGMSLGPM